MTHWKNQKYQEEYLEDFFEQYKKSGLGVSILDSLDLERIDSVSITNYIILLEFVKNHNSILLKNIHRPQPIALCQSDNLETYNSCYEKLNIFNAKDPRYTLFKLLDKTTTKSGSRLFREILSRPLIDPNQIKARYDIVDAFYNARSIGLVGDIRDLLQIVDLERIHRRLSVNKLPPYEIPKLIQALENISNIFQLIKQYSNKTLLELLPSNEIINSMICFMKDIKISFDLELCKKHSLINIDENIFHAGVSPKLDDITSKLQTKHFYLVHIAKVLTAISQKIYLSNKTESTILESIHGELVSKEGEKPTKQELDLWIHENYILEFNIQKNPRKSGGEPYNRYNNYKTATRYQEFENLGGTRSDLSFDIVKKVLKVYKPSSDNNIPKSYAPKLDLESDYPLTIQVKNTEKEGYCLDTTTKRMEALKHEIKQFLKHSPEFLIDLGDMKPMDLLGIKYDIKTSRPKITSEAIQALSNDILKLYIDLKETIQSEYLKQIEELYNKYVKSFEIVIKAINYIDVYTTFAFLVSMYGLVRPTLESGLAESKSSFVQFEDLRNIIVERILENKGELYIPNSLKMSKDDCYLLFGVNSAGKSCFLRSVGMALIMAQAGLYVPAKSFVYYPYTKIFMRTGNQDNVAKGKSSFVMEITEAKEAIMQGDKKFLVLTDEMLASTEVDNSRRIVSAIMEVLNRKQVTYLFATHLLELINLPLVQKMENLRYISMKVSNYDTGDLGVNDPNSTGLNFERKIVDGIPEISNYGSIIASKLIHNDLFRELLKGYNEVNLPSMERNKSRYNNRFIIKICQYCGYKPTDPKHMPLQAHHILFQCNAIGGYVDGVPIHAAGNLIDLCLPCHQDVHQGKYQIKVLQTDSGKKYEFDPPYKT